jgi:hypothetical protein
MYGNGKMRPIETLPGIGGGGIKENDGGDEFKYDIRTFINVIMYPQYNNNNNNKLYILNKIIN